MKTELLITEKRTGKLWDAAPCVSTASYTTNRTGSPGKFTFTLIKAGGISFVEGDVYGFLWMGRWFSWAGYFIRAKTDGASLK